MLLWQLKQTKMLRKKGTPLPPPSTFPAHVNALGHSASPSLLSLDLASSLFSWNSVLPSVHCPSQPATPHLSFKRSPPEALSPRVWGD